MVNNDIVFTSLKLDKGTNIFSVIPYFLCSIFFISHFLGLKDKSKINDLLSLVGLGETGRKPAGKFSTGMKQRLGLAIALLGNPEQWLGSM